MAKQHKIAILGLEHWYWAYPIAGAVSAMKDAELTYVIGEDEDGKMIELDAEKVLQERLHPEGGEGRAEEHRGELPVAHPVQVKGAGGPVQQLDVLNELVPPGLAQHVGQDGVV